eukprot:scaffold87910_cov63-Phaeocystis_antarctica.AAC.3
MVYGMVLDAAPFREIDERDLRRRSMGQRRSPLEVRVVAFLISAAERGPTSQAAHVPLRP